MKNKINVAVLDDYQNVSRLFADWSDIEDQINLTVFNKHIQDMEELIKILLPFEIISVMRERTPLTNDILNQLPNLKLIISTGARNASIDLEAASKLGIEIRNTGYVANGAPELTWALLMAVARKIPQENNNVQNGKWQTTIGTDLAGKTIGIVGLGNIGAKIAAYAKAFDMNVIAWSEHLTAEEASSKSAKLVNKNELFATADFVTLHLVLSDRSRGIVGKNELESMKPSAYLINTSRGPLIDENALIEVLTHNKIAGAAIDVFEQEPLSSTDSFRKVNNLVATPHIGYVTENTYRVFYTDVVKEIKEWIVK
ncbi:D-2-hydroxyacid dehydrogenase family protein [Rhizosphaericola mali]|uniref:D-2-hydroxyacid dehydrogenase family protein n=1 Tax=Rhizosphaericola mali TaxID=2545455 RepID=A0A5P2G5U0_9BACT|nr:D-2-hydroxyacid dehydrogenase family protein [Rhizosphaericola mali]QES88503.1 D-2-hydroxyacid dehydrogenase family protein [Rhizosphaericola mali]